MRWFFIIGLAFTLSACAATGQLYREHDPTSPALSLDTARLIVFRTRDSSQYCARAASVKIDGNIAGNCDYAGFNVFEVTAGKHVLTVDVWDSPGKCDLPIDVSGGNTYFYEIQPRTGNLTAGLVGGLIGMAIESSGKQCGGTFSVAPIEQSAALLKLEDLRMTK